MCTTYWRERKAIEQRKLAVVNPSLPNQTRASPLQLCNGVGSLQTQHELVCSTSSLPGAVVQTTSWTHTYTRDTPSTVAFVGATCRCSLCLFGPLPRLWSDGCSGLRHPCRPSRTSQENHAARSSAQTAAEPSCQAANSPSSLKTLFTPHRDLGEHLVGRLVGCDGRLSGPLSSNTRVSRTSVYRWLSLWHDTLASGNRLSVLCEATVPRSDRSRTVSFRLLNRYTNIFRNNASYNFSTAGCTRYRYLSLAPGTLPRRVWQLFVDSDASGQALLGARDPMLERRQIMEI